MMMAKGKARVSVYTFRMDGCSFEYVSSEGMDAVMEKARMWGRDKVKELEGGGVYNVSVLEDGRPIGTTGGNMDTGGLFGFDAPVVQSVQLSLSF